MISKKILIVEDDEVIREVLRDLLESEGYVVECAANGEEGIQALRREGPLPSLILLDIMMPVKDGFEFRYEQEQDSTLAGVPVVVMTADHNAESKRLRIGAKGFIKKPFNVDDMVGMVERYCI